METNPIEIWDHLVYDTIYPAKLKNNLKDNGAISLLHEESKKATERLRSYLIKETFLRKTTEENKILIEQYQTFSTILLDTIFEYQSDSDIQFELQKIYEQVGNELEIIIHFLESSFAAYFNEDAKVPNFIRAKFEKTIKPQLSRLKKRIGDQEKNQQLLESIFDAIDNILQLSSNDLITFRQLNYFKNLITTIAKLNSDLFKDSKFSPAIIVFISLKFNDDGFVHLILKTVKEALSAAESQETQVALAKEFYKSTSQILECSSEQLFSEKPSPKDAVLDWLAQEIFFLEASYPKKENPAGTTTSKINTSLSVPLLALYIRLFKEAGIITNNNFQELFRAVTSTFTTNRNADVAHNHLHSKFYAIEESAKRKVFDQLMEMAHLCKRIG